MEKEKLDERPPVVEEGVETFKLGLEGDPTLALLDGIAKGLQSSEEEDDDIESASDEGDSERGGPWKALRMASLGVEEEEDEEMRAWF